jgi:hypothetical protein
MCPRLRLPKWNYMDKGNIRLGQLVEDFLLAKRSAGCSTKTTSWYADTLSLYLRFLEAQGLPLILRSLSETAPGATPFTCKIGGPSTREIRFVGCLGKACPRTQSSATWLPLECFRAGLQAKVIQTGMCFKACPGPRSGHRNYGPVTRRDREVTSPDTPPYGNGHTGPRDSANFARHGLTRI